MALKSIFILFSLACKLVAGLISHNAGYVTNIGEYYGGQTRMNAWGVPDINPNSGSSYEVSLTLINYNGDSNGGHISAIRVGLHVYPRLYHNNRLRLFTMWDNAAKTAKSSPCYNTDCPGFVVDNSSKIYPGQAVSPLSQYDGEDRYITFSIRKDPLTQLWTLYREDYSTSMRIGWWQKGILGGLEDKADSVHWVAYVEYPDNDAGPSMGSGHFASEGKHKAAYMADLKLFDQSGNSYSPSIYDDLSEAVDRPDCYDVLPAAVDKFFYGGPAGCRN